MKKASGLHFGFLIGPQVRKRVVIRLVMLTSLVANRCRVPLPILGPDGNSFTRWGGSLSCLLALESLHRLRLDQPVKATRCHALLSPSAMTDLWTIDLLTLLLVTTSHQCSTDTSAAPCSPPSISISQTPLSLRLSYMRQGCSA